MRATVKVVLQDGPVELTFNGNTQSECHTKVIDSVQQGVLSGAFINKLRDGVSVQAALDHAYANLGGTTQPYTLSFEDGTEEHGVIDCSPHALGVQYYETIKNNPDAVERFRYHVSGDCPNQDDCPVVNLALTLGIDHHFRAADSGA